MKKTVVMGAALLLIGAGVWGCTNTAEGAKQDTAADTHAVKEAGDRAVAATDKAVDNAAAATNKAASNVAAATDKALDNTAKAVDKVGKATSEELSLRPKVKLAIVSDKELNNTKNTITVEPSDGVVHLKGVVLTKEMKKRAGEIAVKTLKDAGSTDKVSNDLTVNPSGDSRG